eukprot:EST46295.1 hypothetical protein SS50377_13681 [Spironucleus salmonicida]
MDSIQYWTNKNCFDKQSWIDEDGRNQAEEFLSIENKQEITNTQFQMLSIEKKQQITGLRILFLNDGILNCQNFQSLEYLDVQKSSLQGFQNIKHMQSLVIFLGEDNLIDNIDNFIDLPKLLWLDCPHNNIKNVKNFKNDCSVIQIDITSNPIQRSFTLPSYKQILKYSQNWYKETSQLINILKFREDQNVLFEKNTQVEQSYCDKKKLEQYNQTMINLQKKQQTLTYQLNNLKMQQCITK